MDRSDEIVLPDSGTVEAILYDIINRDTEGDTYSGFFGYSVEEDNVLEVREYDREGELIHTYQARLVFMQ